MGSERLSQRLMLDAGCPASTTHLWCGGVRPDQPQDPLLCGLIPPPPQQPPAVGVVLPRVLELLCRRHIVLLRLVELTVNDVALSFEFLARFREPPANAGDTRS